MKYLFIKWQKNLYNFIKFELIKLRYKFIFYNCNFPYQIRQTAFIYLSLLPSHSYITRLRNICLNTNKPRSLINFLMTSRYQVKTKIPINEYSGIKFLSW
jgi:ribosomal protein S14